MHRAGCCVLICVWRLQQGRQQRQLDCLERLQGRNHGKLGGGFWAAQRIDLLFLPHVGWHRAQEIHLKPAAFHLSCVSECTGISLVLLSCLPGVQQLLQEAGRNIHLPSLLGPCQQLRATRTKGRAMRSPGPVILGTHSSGTVPMIHRSSFLYSADLSSPEFSVRKMDRPLMAAHQNPE
jgi:hypothetical protein